ncbi:hypothetical protein ACP7H9_02095 [Idiomarina sp. ST20R2A10]|mgnify:CR=1 FL=1|uniref:hypothetical protein n=1 Tax=Idiomarina sp. ST20R2A10 TaxID=3418369 RepID=UPI003EC51540
MEIITIKEVIMLAIALYGAALSTYSYNRNRVKIELHTACVIMALTDNGDALKPMGVIKLSVKNKGQSSCYVEKLGLVDSFGKFLPLDILDGIDAPSEVQPNFSDGKITSISRTNSREGSLVDDREVKPNSKSSAFFKADSLEGIVEEFGADKVYAYVECSGISKKKELDYSGLLKLDKDKN